MKFKEHLWAACFATLGLVTAAPPFSFHANAQATTPPAGQLKCHVAGGLSFIVGSSRKVDCVYTPAGPVPPEAYAGRINKIGIYL